MRILLLQTVSDRNQPWARFDHCLGILSSLLKYDGFTLEMLTTRGHDPRALYRAVVQARPQFVIAIVRPASHSAMRRNLAWLAENYPLPVLAIGPYASARPAEVFAFPGIQAMIVGEYERPAAAYLAAVRDGAEPEGIAGLWTQRQGRIERTALGGLVRDLDELPHPDRTIFPTRNCIEQTGEFPIKAARGCSRWCGYCVNDWFHDLYKEPDHFLRYRSCEDVIDEVATALSTWPQIRTIRFLDHALLSDRDWAGQLAGEWSRRISSPTTCHVRLEEFAPTDIELLEGLSCGRVHTHIASGSSFIRNEIFGMDLSDERIRSVCATLAEADIAVSADVFVGCPYETEISIEDTLELLWSIRLEKVNVKIFHPFPATRAEELCGEQGWITARSVRGRNPNQPVLDMPSLGADKIIEIARKLPGLVQKGPRARARKAFARINRRRR